MLSQASIEVPVSCIIANNPNPSTTSVATTALNAVNAAGLQNQSTNMQSRRRLPQPPVANANGM